jgi:hypothetical protein
MPVSQQPPRSVQTISALAATVKAIKAAAEIKTRIILISFG